MAGLGEITVKLDIETLDAIKSHVTKEIESRLNIVEMVHEKRIELLRKALKDALHVMEKGIEVRMMDQWPALKPILPVAIANAKKTLKETE